MFPSAKAVFFEAGPGTEEEVLIKELKKHPPGTLASGVFANVSGKLVALKSDKPTEVFKLGLKLSESGEFTFWQNVDPAEEPRGKAPKWATRQALSFQIRSGVLESIDEPKRRGYIFRWDKREEVFVARRDEHLTSKNDKLPSPYPPNLQPIGFKLENGVEYLYRTSAGLRSELATAQAAAKEHPDSKVVARLFRGEAGSRLEIALTGQTPVFRTNLKIDGRDITLWSIRTTNVPAK